MIIEQFFDIGLAHSSYAIISDGEAVLIDPARNPQPYYDFTQLNEARIMAVIETHPHADFVSSHLEIYQSTGAVIYVSKLVGADYPHQTFDDGDELQIGKIVLKAKNTPGHSPDSISIFITNEDKEDYAIFTGDTLFVGDVGRPDLRENAGNLKAQREELARMMYQTTRDVFMKIEKDLLIYPAHGQGSLCGRSLSSDRFTSMKRELQENYALQPMNEKEFMKLLLEGQPYIPKYFGYNVDLNKKGAPPYRQSINKVPRPDANILLDSSLTVVDARSKSDFVKGHLKGAINIPNGGKFETWLGSIIGPEEKFYLIGANPEELEDLLAKCAKIGYESLIAGALTNPDTAQQQSPGIDLEDFKLHPEKYTIVDLKNPSEVAHEKPFENSIAIPLYELRERAREITTEKPIVVHCAGGYRSAIGSSILEKVFENTKVLDLGEAIGEFKKIKV